MIFALDIETIPNESIISFLPEPSIDSRLKDPVKIADAKANAKQKQLEDMALDALTGRVACVAAVGKLNGVKDKEYSEVISCSTDEEEIKIIQSIMRMLGNDQVRIVTWNGIGFDLPFIYKRAMILGIEPAHFDAPPLPVWMKRYSTDRHYDLMQIWGGWSSMKFAKLNDVARMILREQKEDIDVTKISEMLKSVKGRMAVADYCLQDTRLSWKLWNKFNGTLFV